MTATRSTSSGTGGRRPLVDRVRTVEADEFRRWFRRTNARRTRTVGMVLAAFAVVLTVAAHAGLDAAPWWVFALFLAATVFGILITTTGLRRSWLRLSYVGELAIVGTAVGWMFFAVATRLEIGYGLAEFVIGILGLALLRYMRPRIALVVYPLLAVGYGLVLRRASMFEFEAWINGAVFCTFAGLWAIRTYNSRVTEFRNQRLIEEINRQNAQLLSIALQDPLTGLPNRRYYDQAVGLRWQDQTRVFRPQILCLFDIDHFKRYNDRYGHPRGDLCLQRVARVLTAELGGEGVCCRLGGEEFAVLMEGVVLQRGGVVAERLARRVREETDVTVSGGVAQVMPGESSADELYQAADAALYRAKRRGRDRVELAMALESPVDPA